MNAMNPKALVEAAFADLETGSGGRFWELVSDDAVWTMRGSTAWSGIYRGKQAILDRIFVPLRAQFAEGPTFRTERIIAEGDVVVVECRGAARTKRGKAYNNSYCLIYRFADGKIVEIVEHLDTQLVEDVLDPPQRAR